MAERRKEVGACGNACMGCQDYLVLVIGDESLRERVAETLTKEVGRTVSPEEVGCEGCWGGRHSDLVASLDCRIRQCVDGKGYATCAECADFPCATYLEQFPEDSDYTRNIRAIRETGLDVWIAGQKSGQ